MLLNLFNETTSTPVDFDVSEVELDSNKIFDFPCIYITGTIDFRWTDRERDMISRYLNRGGILFVEAGCGRPTFDAAFRREMKKVLPEENLKLIDLDSFIFRFPNNIKYIEVRPALARKMNEQKKIKPHLEGIWMNGNLAVIYSPFDLSGGWELAQAPYDLGIESRDSMDLGVNILSYIIMQ
jgi:hypothetical protein